MSTPSPTPRFALQPNLDPVELARMELALLEHAKTLARHAVRPGALLAGRYRIERVLAREPHGVVANALHEGSSREVTLRVMARAHASSARLTCIQEEARALARLESRHVARILDVGRLPNGALYVVRERIEGRSVAELARESGGLALGEALTLLAQIAEAVDEAHRHGVVLRDLQPRYIRLARVEGEPIAKICDLGASAVLSGDGSDEEAIRGMAPSPSAAPEVLRGGPVDARADLWSLGCLLYELLAGGPAFAGEGAALVVAISREAPTPLAAVRPDLPRTLQPLIDWALDKRPSHRPPSVRAFLEALLPLANVTARIDIQRLLARPAPRRDAVGPASVPLPLRQPSSSGPSPRGARPWGPSPRTSVWIPVIDEGSMGEPSIPIDVASSWRSSSSIEPSRPVEPPPPAVPPPIYDPASVDLSLELVAEGEVVAEPDQDGWTHTASPSSVPPPAPRRVARKGLIASLFASVLPLALLVLPRAARPDVV
jgi:eukaryotic-like serine/threonine-protein kinase